MPTYLELTAWMEEAECRGANPKLFFPSHTSANYEADGPGGYKDARPYCKRCNVVDQCLHYALVTFPHHDDDFGMWGGTTPRQRRKIKRMQRGTRFLVA